MLERATLHERIDDVMLTITAAASGFIGIEDLRRHRSIRRLENSRSLPFTEAYFRFGGETVSARSATQGFPTFTEACILRRPLQKGVAAAGVAPDGFGYRLHDTADDSRRVVFIKPQYVWTLD